VTAAAVQLNKEIAMQYITLGKAGMKVSRACMGTMTFGGQADEEECRKIFRTAMDAGINFYDTADVYNAGRSEEILGELIRGHRDELVIATKVCGIMGEGAYQVGLSRKWILQECEASLRRLQTDHVDLYQLHHPDYGTGLDETMMAMDQLVRDGKVRYVGCSNYAAWQIVQMLWVCDRRNLVPVASVQPMYNLLARGIEQELLPFCCEFGLGTMVYNPLAGGLLTGKHLKGKSPAEGTRFDGNRMYQDRYWSDANFDAVAELLQVADAAGKSLLELSLQWLSSQPGVTCIILGASRATQLEKNLKALDGEIGDAIRAGCDAVWRKLSGVAPKYNR